MNAWEQYSATGDDEHSSFLEDEAQHFEDLPARVAERLTLITVGLELSFGLTAQTLNEGHLSDRAAVLGLLGQKAVDHIRTAQIGLSVGHYQSVPVLIRPALVTIGIMILGIRKAALLERWLFLTSVSRNQFPNMRPQFDRMVRALERQALRAYDELLSTEGTPDSVQNLVRNCCVHSHPSLTGLAEALDIDASDPTEMTNLLLENYFGEDAPAMLRSASGDPYQAIKTLLTRQTPRATFEYTARRSRSAINESLQAEQTEEDSVDFGFSCLRPNLLEQFSSLMLSTVHHLYDVAAEIMGPLDNPETQATADEWHEISLANMTQLSI